MSARSGELVQAQRHCYIKPLVLPAGTAWADRLVLARENPRPELVSTIVVHRDEKKSLRSAERGPVLAPLPVRYHTSDLPHLPILHIERRGPSLIARPLAMAFLGGGARRADGPRLVDRRLAEVLIIS